MHAASGQALEATHFSEWAGDKSGWGGAPFSNKSDTAEFVQLAPLERASRFRWSAKGDTLHLASQPRLGLEATYREFDFAGNRVMLWGPHHHDVGWYCTFTLHADNTVSPKTTSKRLVLGFGRCLQSKHGFHGDRDQCILVPHGDARQLVVYPVGQAPLAPVQKSISGPSSSSAPPPPPVVMGTVVMGEPVRTETYAGSAGKAPMALVEQVEVLRRELGLSGEATFKDVVHQAAEQLGLATEGKNITQIATECMQALGR